VANVFDLSDGGKDITGQFMRSAGDLSIGWSVLGLSRDQFLNTCYIWQGGIDQSLISVH
jgi:hypothetical protein